MTLGGFQVTVTADTLEFDRVGFFLVPLSDEDLAVFVFGRDAEFFFG